MAQARKEAAFANAAAAVRDYRVNPRLEYRYYWWYDFLYEWMNHTWKISNLSIYLHYIIIIIINDINIIII